MISTNQFKLVGGYTSVERLLNSRVDPPPSV
jgi:hypothetical protein